MRRLNKVIGCTALGCAIIIVVPIVILFLIPFWNILGEVPEISEYQGIKVRNPVMCQKINFSPVYNKPLMLILGDKSGWKLRVAQARLFCGRQWDHKFFAHAAEILEREHLLLPDFAFGGNNLYSPHIGSQEVINFLKVLDAAPILVGEDALLEEFRKRNPNLPSLEEIRRVREEIGLRRICTVSQPLPQRYVVSEDPPVTLITDVGLTTNLESLTREVLNAAFSQRLNQIMAEVEGLAGSRFNSYGNPQAAMVALLLQFEMSLGLAKRAELEGTERLRDLTVLFLRHHGRNYEIGDREAIYNPAVGLIQGRSPGNIPILFNIPDQDLRDILATLIPASLTHEFHHYLFFRRSIADSGFFLEGEATAYGEADFRGALAGLAVPRDDPLRDLTDKVRASFGEDPELLQQWNREVQQRIASTPYTDTQCRFIRLLSEGYLQTGKDLPIERLLTLTPRMFQEQSANEIEDAYAVAWLVFHVANSQQKTWSPKLEALVRRMNRGEPRLPEEVELLRTINEESISWLRTTQGKRLECDQADERLEVVRSSSP